METLEIFSDIYDNCFHSAVGVRRLPLVGLEKTRTGPVTASASTSSTHPPVGPLRLSRPTWCHPFAKFRPTRSRLRHKDRPAHAIVTHVLRTVEFGDENLENYTSEVQLVRKGVNEPGEKSISEAIFTAGILKTKLPRDERIFWVGPKNTASFRIWRVEAFSFDIQ